MLSIVKLAAGQLSYPFSAKIGSGRRWTNWPSRATSAEEANAALPERRFRGQGSLAHPAEWVGHRGQQGAGQWWTHKTLPEAARTVLGVSAALIHPYWLAGDTVAMRVAGPEVARPLQLAQGRHRSMTRIGC